MPAGNHKLVTCVELPKVDERQAQVVLPDDARGLSATRDPAEHAFFVIGVYRMLFDPADRKGQTTLAGAPAYGLPCMVRRLSELGSKTGRVYEQGHGSEKRA
jgi:hypothetical protein